MTGSTLSTALLALVLLLGSRFAAAERWTGRVLDAESGEAIPGAYVELQIGSASFEALSEQDGTFAVDAGPGPATIRVQAVGYEQTSQIVASAVERAEFALALDLESGEVFTIVAKAPPLPAASAHALTGEALRALPGSGGDVLKSVQSLPGVARVPFGGGGLVLRGTSPRDSSVYLDGIEVPMLYHFGNLASFYPSALLDSLEIVPSGFGAAYGRAQGGMVTLDSKAGRRDRWRSAGEVSLLDASVRADGAGGKNSSWSLAIRRSYIDGVLGLPANAEERRLEVAIAPESLDRL